ncbi:hypothetical protein JS44_00745 [Anoxybacillus flavithermus]|uniref:Uncharacterized protein n=1 Tax=Anoxybacillus flavithermus TaxID=33934 RepID=A0A094J3D4_9BACL|nr:hypothetical protein JS44_00745 [Anoxybacillus flavithermus]
MDDFVLEKEDEKREEAEMAEEETEQKQPQENKEQERLEEKEERVRQRSGVPYNVMMLKQDRENGKSEKTVNVRVSVLIVVASATYPSRRR